MVAQHGAHCHRKEIKEVRQVIIMCVSDAYFVAVPNDLIVNRLSHTTKSHDIFFDPGTMTGMPTSWLLRKTMLGKAPEAGPTWAQL